MSLRCRIGLHAWGQPVRDRVRDIRGLDGRVIAQGGEYFTVVDRVLREAGLSARFTPLRDYRRCERCGQWQVWHDSPLRDPRGWVNDPGPFAPRVQFTQDEWWEKHRKDVVE